MEVDGVSIMLLVSKHPAVHLDYLDPAVDTFRITVVHFHHNGIEVLFLSEPLSSRIRFRTTTSPQ
jgi:hypothetical protein